MLVRFHRITFVVFTIGLISATASLPCSGQASIKSSHPVAPARKPAASDRTSEARASLEVLVRLRALRDCWRDPYMLVQSDDPRLQSDSLYLRCGSNYPLRLAELQEAVGQALLSVRDRSISRQISAAMEVFNDLDTLRSLFNSRAYFLTTTVRVSDIFPIVRKYNIQYQENRVSKVRAYESIIPSRRTHIDALATLIGNPPPDSNPTITPTQAAAAVDDLTWSFANRQKDPYNWYLRRYPQGRHAAEARDLIARHDEIQLEQEAQLVKIRDQLKGVSHKVFEAYVRGDKAAFERLLGSNFPLRALYIARLRAQPNVRSFEIQNFEVRSSPIDPENYRAKVDVQYRSLLDQRREYHNTITYRRIQGRWQIIEWQSP